MVELINVTKEEAPKTSYPTLIRTEGIAPSQYGTKSLLGERFSDVEEKYDLTQGTEGFGTEGEEGVGDDFASTEDSADETSSDAEEY